MGHLQRIVVLLAIWLGLVGGAFAHASLIAASPAANSVIASPPSALSLEFNEPVSPIVLTLIDPSGAKTKLTDFSLVGSTLEIVAPSPIGNGTFVLSYRVISADGHPVGGSVVFSVGAPSAGAAVPVATADWAMMAAIWLGKVAFYAGLLFGIGGVFFRHLIAATPIRGSRVERGALIAGLVAAPLLVALQGVDALGAPLPALASAEAWQAGLATSFALSAGIGWVALLLALVVARFPMTPGRAVTIIAFAGVGLTLASTGHAATADPQWLTRPAVFLHGLGVAFWAGALLPLWHLLRRPGPATLPGLRRFSRAIPLVLAILFIAGGALAVVQIGSIGALITTPYGLVLLTKLGLFACVLILAAYNRWFLTAAAEHSETAAIRRLMRVIVLETLLIFAMTGVVALWRFTPPPRAAIALVKASPLDLHIHTDQLMAQVSLAAGGVGSTEVSIFPMAADFGAVDPEALTLVISNAAAGVEPIKYPAVKQADGSWLASGVLFPVGGTWTLRLDVRLSDFKMVSVQDDLVLGSPGSP